MAAEPPGAGEDPNGAAGKGAQLVEKHPVLGRDRHPMRQAVLRYFRRDGPPIAFDLFPAHPWFESASGHHF